MDGIFSQISLAQVMPPPRDFTSPTSYGTGLDIWGQPVPPPPPQQLGRDDELDLLESDMPTEPRPLEPTVIQLDVPAQQQQQQTPVDEELEEVHVPPEENTPPDFWRNTIDPSPVPLHNQHVFEAQLRFPGDGIFWPRDRSQPHWTDLDYDFPSAALAQEDEDVEAVETDETDEQRVERFARETEEGAAHMARENEELAELIAREIDERVEARRLARVREETLQWFRAHGRTVQAPALNVEQILAIDRDRGRHSIVEKRVLKFFEILELFQTMKRDKVGETSVRKEDWVEDEADWVVDDVGWEEGEDDEEDRSSSSSAMDVDDVEMAFSGDEADDHFDVSHHGSTLETEMVVDVDVYVNNSNFDSIFGSSFHSIVNSMIGSSSSSDSSEEAESTATSPSLPSTLPTLPDDNDNYDDDDDNNNNNNTKTVLTLQYFLDSITPDEAVVFRYFMDHPEVTTPVKMEAHAKRHKDSKNDDGNGNGNGHLCSNGPGEWWPCYVEELLVLYAKYEQAATNEYVAGLDPEDSQNLDDAFLLSTSGGDGDGDDDDDAEEHRTYALPEQWQTAPDEGERSWLQYLKPYFQQGFVPPLGYQEHMAFRRASFEAAVDSWRPPLRMVP
ncbi:hypothetical protein Sste5346_002034 [Sporothrix stenoceras]|uniref:Uncharacterized protein n=1 Tax=Sporothrix stenoceras TaxID=5173 RepID=A0ABR3ZL78_9PEZI